MTTDWNNFTKRLTIFLLFLLSLCYCVYYPFLRLNSICVLELLFVDKIWWTTIPTFNSNWDYLFLFGSFHAIEYALRHGHTVRTYPLLPFTLFFFYLNFSALLSVEIRMIEFRAFYWFLFCFFFLLSLR